MIIYYCIIIVTFIVQFCVANNIQVQMNMKRTLGDFYSKNDVLNNNEKFLETEDLLRTAVLPSYIKNFISSSTNLDNFFKNIQESPPISPNCTLDLVLALESFISPNITRRWAFEMVDAWGKQVSGFMSGNMNALGDPTQCVNAIGTHNERTIKGRYCRNYFLPRQLAESIGSQGGIMNEEFTKGIKRSTATFPELLEMMGDLTPPLMLPLIAACWPISCTENDTQNILMAAANATGLTEIVIPRVSNCYTNEKRDLNTGDIFMISFLSVLGFTCILATLVDLYKATKTNKDKNENAHSKKSNTDNLGLRCLLAFSINTNIRKWSNTQTGGDNLRCINGIRFFSMCWVVLGHSYVALLTHPRWNMVDVKKIAGGDADITILAVLNATYSVDSFFLLSGTLVSYNILKALKKGNGKLNFPLLYIHRYLRLTPMYAIVIGLLATLVPLITTAPLWVIIEFNGQSCRKHWWHNLLYVNNLVNYETTEENPEGVCHGESWYLANDMQFFIFAPIVVYVIYHFKKIGLGLLSLLTIGSVMTPFLITYINELLPMNLPNRDPSDVSDYTDQIYLKPWSRAGPYVIGIWLGYILYKQGTEKSRMNIFFVIIGWILSASITLFIIFGVKRYFDASFEIPRVEAAFYGGFSRTAYAVCIAWVIYACVKGYGSIVGDFLSWKAFIPLARMTYATYLVSLTTQDIQVIWETKQTIEYNNYNSVNLYFLNLVMALLIGFIFMITMESPFIQLEKILLERFENNPSQSSVKDAFVGVERNGIFYDNQISYNNVEIGNSKQFKGH